MSLDELVKLAESMRVTPDDLDDAVYDSCLDEIMNELNSEENEDGQTDIISAAEHRASDVNNEGLEGQIAYLLEGNGWEVVRDAIVGSQRLRNVLDQWED